MRGGSTLDGCIAGAFGSDLLEHHDTQIESLKLRDR